MENHPVKSNDTGFSRLIPNYFFQTNHTKKGTSCVISLSVAFFVVATDDDDEEVTSKQTQRVLREVESKNESRVVLSKVQPDFKMDLFDRLAHLNAFDYIFQLVRRVRAKRKHN